MADGSGNTLQFDPVQKAKGYNLHPSKVELIEVVRFFPFNLGNALKYTVRHAHKGGKQDLDKAVYYLLDHQKLRGKQWAIDLCAADKLALMVEHEPDPDTAEILKLFQYYYVTLWTDTTELVERVTQLRERFYPT